MIDKNKLMKIKKVTEDYILFDNDKKITFDHERDCCEYNFADFKHITRKAKKMLFPQELRFEWGLDDEFYFYDVYGNAVRVNCYTKQNGYYTDNIQIYYDGKEVLSGTCDRYNSKIYLGETYNELIEFDGPHDEIIDFEVQHKTLYVLQTLTNCLLNSRRDGCLLVCNDCPFDLTIEDVEETLNDVKKYFTMYKEGKRGEINDKTKMSSLWES